MILMINQAANAAYRTLYINLHLFSKVCHKTLVVLCMYFVCTTPGTDLHLNIKLLTKQQHIIPYRVIVKYFSTNLIRK